MYCHARAKALAADNVEITVVTINYPFCDCKPETGAALCSRTGGVGAIKPIKYMPHVFGGDSNAVVAHCYRGGSIFIP